MLNIEKDLFYRSKGIKSFRMPSFSVSSFRETFEFTEKTKGELRQLFHPYYILNLLLTFSFLFVKLTKPFCEILFAPGPVIFIK